MIRKAFRFFVDFVEDFGFIKGCGGGLLLFGFLVALAVACVQWTVDWWESVRTGWPLREQIERYSQLTSSGLGAGEPGSVVVGRTLPIAGSSLDWDAWKTLESCWRPGSPEEIETVWQRGRCEQEAVGEYKNGATAYQWRCSVSVFDVRKIHAKPLLVESRSVLGSGPPFQTSASFSDSGRKPTTEELLAPLLSPSLRRSKALTVACKLPIPPEVHGETEPGPSADRDAPAEATP